MKIFKNRKSFILFTLFLVLSLIHYIIFRWSTGTILVTTLTLTTAIHILIKWLNKKYNHTLLKLIKHLFRYGLISVGTLSILILILVANPQRTCQDIGDKAAESDYIITLGAGLNGREVSKRLKLRLDKTLEAAALNPNLKIIVSGGQGSDELISEAEAMSIYLMDHGIERNRIILEDKSRSTIENILYSKEKIDKLNELGKVLIISADFHMFRAKMIAKKLGLNAQMTCSQSEGYIKSNYMIREIPAVSYSFLKIQFNF